MNKELHEELKTLRLQQKQFQKYLKNLVFKVTGNQPKASLSNKDLIKTIVDYYQFILHSLPGNVYWKDKDGRYLGCNNNILKFHGLENYEDLIGKTYDEYLDKDEAKRLKELDLDIMSKGKLRNFEERGYDSAGKKIIFLTQKIPLKNLQGKTTGILGISFDITERKKQENELEKIKKNLEQITQTQQTHFYQLRKKILGDNFNVQSVEKNADEIIRYFQNILKIMPGNIYWKDKNGRYLGCNDNLLKIHGYKEVSEIIDKTYEDIFDPKTAQKLKEKDQQIMKRDQPVSLEENGYDEEGKPATYITHKVPLHNSQGDVIGLLGISLNITERKKAEVALKKAKEEAEAANAAKTQFVANMEHDLRTPTSGIYGLLKGWVDHEPPKSERKKFYSLLSQSAWQLLKLLDSILEFTRMESGKRPVLNKKFRIRTVMDYLLKLEKPAALAKNLNLTIDVDENIPKIIKGDRFRVYRILINLVSNAIKFTQKGSVKISVKLVEKDEKNNHIFLAFIIEDTGIGIAKKDQDRIYEKFVRLDPSNRAQYHGTGLGLTIVKEFIHDLEGEIDLVSQLGKGTTFTIILPFDLPILEDPEATSWEDDKDSYEEMVWFH